MPKNTDTMHAILSMVARCDLLTDPAFLETVHMPVSYNEETNIHLEYLDKSTPSDINFGNIASNSVSRRSLQSTDEN